MACRRETCATHDLFHHIHPPPHTPDPRTMTRREMNRKVMELRGVRRTIFHALRVHLGRSDAKAMAFVKLTKEDALASRYLEEFSVVRDRAKRARAARVWFELVLGKSMKEATIAASAATA